jgi:tRNA dimethylallyltransferase
MAIYRKMDIGTAKPTTQQRCAVPHHLIDIVEPHEDFSLARYLESVARVVSDIRQRGREVLFVGGTPLYLKGLLRGIFEGPSADWKLRQQLLDEAQRHGPGYLHARLSQVDPLAAARLHPNDSRRLVRALEVFERTGHPISQLQQQFDVGQTAQESRVFVLDWPREQLVARIHARVLAMFATGLVDEVRCLLAQPQPLSSTARQAVGYREVIEHLEGHTDLAQTVELVCRHTRQLAKRQGTWFRSLSECRFVPMTEGTTPPEVANHILLMANQSPPQSS